MSGLESCICADWLLLNRLLLAHIVEEAPVRLELLVSLDIASPIVQQRLGLFVKSHELMDEVLHLIDWRSETKDLLQRVETFDDLRIGFTDGSLERS